MHRGSIGFVLASCWATAAAAQTVGEWTTQAPLPGLVIGHRVAEGGSLIIERIPRGETVQDWSRMVTTQRFAGVIARGGTLDEWHGHFIESLRNGCPGYRASPTVRVGTGARPALEFRIDCPRNPATGRPEVFLLRAIAGTADLHVAQVAFRHVPTAVETAWARRQLDSVTFCTRRSRLPACSAGPE